MISVIILKLLGNSCKYFRKILWIIALSKMHISEILKKKNRKKFSQATFSE